MDLQEDTSPVINHGIYGFEHHDNQIHDNLNDHEKNEAHIAPSNRDTVPEEKNSVMDDESCERKKLQGSNIESTTDKVAGTVSLKGTRVDGCLCKGLKEITFTMIRNTEHENDFVSGPNNSEIKLSPPKRDDDDGAGDGDGDDDILDQKTSEVIKPTLLDLLLKAHVEDESFIPSFAVEVLAGNNICRQISWSSKSSEEYEGFSSQRNTKLNHDFDNITLVSAESNITTQEETDDKESDRNKKFTKRSTVSDLDKHDHQLVISSDRLLEPCTDYIEGNKENKRSQWRQKIERIIATITSKLGKKQQNGHPLQSILDEVEVKRIMKPHGSNKRKRDVVGRKIKQKKFWGLGCCSSSSSSSTNAKKLEEWETQLEKYYLSTW